jgi:hypothetical protein
MDKFLDNLNLTELQELETKLEARKSSKESELSAIQKKLDLVKALIAFLNG